MIFVNSNTEFKEEVASETLNSSVYELVLHNDDYNTFPHVIHCLVKYCKHDEIQAEQCAWIVHTKGKCSVKSGELTDLLPICEALCEQQLSASIEIL
jgi:ATP-dependent Clp protease adaptor protein ClpS